MSNGACFYCMLCCGASKILCYQFCCRCLHKKRVIKKDVNVMVLGMEGCGKSYLLAQLCGEDTGSILPTNGFSLKDISLMEYIVHAKELGGSEKVYQYWEHYIDDAHGVIWVIDGNNIMNVDKDRDRLNSVVKKTELKNKPLLVLVSKISLETDCKEKLINALGLAELCKESSFIVKSCTSVVLTKQNLENFASTLLLPEFKP